VVAEEQVIDNAPLVHQELQILVVQVVVQVFMDLLQVVQVILLPQLQHKVLLVEMVDQVQVLMDLVVVAEQRL
jgi:hypothetical protein